MDRTLFALLIGFVCAILFGYGIAQRSNQHQRILGGAWARVFHYIGASAVVGILPMVLACLILGLGFGTAFPLALLFLLIGWVGLMIYAAFERVAKAKLSPKDNGWTREDASKFY